MQDITLTRVERQLSSVLTVVLASAREAERFRDQTLADDIHELVRATKRILDGIGERGQSYKPR